LPVDDRGPQLAAAVQNHDYAGDYGTLPLQLSSKMLRFPACLRAAKSGK
jgi:hypothetical protein